MLNRFLFRNKSYFGNQLFFKMEVNIWGMYN